MKITHKNINADYDNMIVPVSDKDNTFYPTRDSSISKKDLEIVAKAAADVHSAEELAKVVSSLKLIDEEYWKDVMMAWSSREYSPAALGKMISDDLYNMYLSVENCEVTSSTYVDVSGVIGEEGEEFNEAELKNIYNDLHDYDPVVMDYASFEDWLDDSVRNGYLEILEASSTVYSSINNNESYCKHCGNMSVVWDEHGNGVCDSCGETYQTSVESAKVTGYNSDFMLKLAKEIKDKCHEVMTSEEYGWPEDEVDDYLVVEVEPTELQGDPYYKVEIRSEMTYSGMTGLAEECNPIVEKYDKNAYFDHVTGGIIDAYIRVSSDIKGAYYGGAFDIDPEQYFTKEEYMEFAQNVEDELNEIFNTKIRYTDVYALEPNSIYLDVADKDGNEFSWGVIIDMRKIRKPSDLEKYHDSAVTKLSREFRRWYAQYPPESTVESAVYRIPERSVEPPPKKSFGLDDINDYIEIKLDDDVEVYNDEDRYGFDIEGIDDICEDVILDYEDSLKGLVDESDVQELIEFMIDSRLPDEPGKYHLRAKIKIFYEISGLWENEYGEEIDDDATIRYDYNKSTVDDFQCKKID